MSVADAIWPTLTVSAMALVALVVCRSRIVRVGPDQALIITRRPHRKADASGFVRLADFRVVRRGSTFVWPFLERVEKLSLELMTAEIRTDWVYAADAKPLQAKAIAQFRVKDGADAIALAADLFLDKTPTQIVQIAHQTMEGHLRAAIGKSTAQELRGDRFRFAEFVESEAASDFATMGLKIASFTIIDLLIEGRPSGSRDSAETAGVEPVVAQNPPRSAAGQDFRRCRRASCGYENPGDAKYCCRCAAPLIRT